MDTAYGTRRAYPKTGSTDTLQPAYPKGISFGVELGDGWSQIGANDFEYLTGAEQFPALTLSPIRAGSAYQITFTALIFTGSAPKLDCLIGYDTTPVAFSVAATGAVSEVNIAGSENRQIRFVVSDNTTTTRIVITGLKINTAVVPVAVNPLVTLADVWLKQDGITGGVGNPLTAWANDGLLGAVADGTDITGQLDVIADPETGLTVVNSPNDGQQLRPANVLSDVLQPFVMFMAFRPTDITQIRALFDNYGVTRVVFSLTATGEVRINSGMGTTLTGKTINLNVNNVIAIQYDGATTSVWFNDDIKLTVAGGTNLHKGYSLFTKGGGGMTYNGFIGSINEFATVPQSMSDPQIELTLSFMNDLWR